MRAVVQRVGYAKVEVDGLVTGEITDGLLVYLGVMEGDTESDAGWMDRKISGLRIFDDSGGKMNLSLLDKAYDVLLVSQFTICGNVKKGNRPSFDPAAEPGPADELYRHLAGLLRNRGIRVEMGEFQARMEVSSMNDGPVTILMDSKKTF
jgi:D-aminoacyl-tRNA deacylase